MKTRVKKRRDGKIDVCFIKSKSQQANVGLTIEELLQLSININTYLSQYFMIQQNKR